MLLQPAPMKGSFMFAHAALLLPPWQLRSNVWSVHKSVGSCLGCICMSRCMPLAQNPNPSSPHRKCKSLSSILAPQSLTPSPHGFNSISPWHLNWTGGGRSHKTTFSIHLRKATGPLLWPTGASTTALRVCGSKPIEGVLQEALQ